MPFQTGADVAKRVEEHLVHEFRKRQSPNHLRVEETRTGDWWLGEPTDKAYVAASAAIEKVWGVPPIHVREGGTMPITSFLTATLKAPAIHIPLGCVRVLLVTHGALV